MYRPNRIGEAVLYGAGQRSVRLSVGNFNGSDVEADEEVVYTHLKSTSVAEDADCVTWQIADSGRSLSTGMKVAFGLCMAAPVRGINTLYEYSMSAVGDATIGVQARPFVGQLSGTSASPVQQIGSSAQRNPTLYCLLPYDQFGTFPHASSSGKVLIGEDLISESAAVHKSNPVIFGFVIVNHSSGASTLKDIDISISALRYAADLDAFDPVR